MIRDIKPDVIITHWENSMHRDHRHAHKIAMDAYFFAALKRIEREKPAHWTRRVYFSENWEDMEGYEPDIYVNIPEPIFEQYCDAVLLQVARPDAGLPGRGDELEVRRHAEGNEGRPDAALR